MPLCNYSLISKHKTLSRVCISDWDPACCSCWQLQSLPLLVESLSEKLAQSISCYFLRHRLKWPLKATGPRLFSVNYVARRTCLKATAFYQKKIHKKQRLWKSVQRLDLLGEHGKIPGPQCQDHPIGNNIQSRPRPQTSSLPILTWNSWGRLGLLNLVVISLKEEERRTWSTPPRLYSFESILDKNWATGTNTVST